MDGSGFLGPNRPLTHSFILERRMDTSSPLFHCLVLSCGRSRVETGAGRRIQEEGLGEHSFVLGRQTERSGRALACTFSSRSECTRSLETCAHVDLEETEHTS